MKNEDLPSLIFADEDCSLDSFDLDSDIILKTPNSGSKCLDELASDTGNNFQLTIFKKAKAKVGPFDSRPTERPCNQQVYGWRNQNREVQRKICRANKKWYSVFYRAELKQISGQSDRPKIKIIAPDLIAPGEQFTFSALVENAKGTYITFDLNNTIYKRIVSNRVACINIDKAQVDFVFIARDSIPKEIQRAVLKVKMYRDAGGCSKGEFLGEDFDTVKILHELPEEPPEEEEPEIISVKPNKFSARPGERIEITVRTKNAAGLNLELKGDPGGLIAPVSQETVPVQSSNSTTVLFKVTGGGEPGEEPGGEPGKKISEFLTLNNDGTATLDLTKCWFHYRAMGGNYKIGDEMGREFNLGGGYSVKVIVVRDSGAFRDGSTFGLDIKKDGKRIVGYRLGKRDRYYLAGGNRVINVKEFWGWSSDRTYKVFSNSDLDQCRQYESGEGWGLFRIRIRFKV